MYLARFMVLGVACAAPALAQTTPAAPSTATPSPAAATLAPGAQVHDAAGQPVGSVVSVAASAVVVDTGAHQVGLPPNAIGPDGKGGFVSSLTKVQLDTAYEQQVAKTDAQLQQKLVPGTSVSTFQGAATAGTVKAADEQYVTLATDKGDVKLPRTLFALNASGGLVVRMTAAEFATALSSVKPAG